MEQILYFVAASTPTPARAAQAALDSVARHVSPLIARGVQFQLETSLPRALERLRSGAFYALIVDARVTFGSPAQTTALELLHTLFDEHDIAGPVSRDQTWLVVDPDKAGAELAFEAGRIHIAGSIVAPFDDAGWRDIWLRVEATIQHRREGRIAICLAGGGIEGLFYELGVLRALQYFLPNFQLQDTDILCGISAGAIVSGFMANGLGPREIARGFQYGEGRIEKINKGDIFDPNFGELAQRLGTSALGLLRGRHTPLQALFRLAPTGVFAGAGLRRYLDRQLNRPGMVNRFTDLKHKLFIGATDQDTAEHVVFGSPGWDHVPIHLAIRASAALTPFYTPQRIEGRYYMDGGFTRTTNMRIAVQSGASLVILIDPLVPIVSPRPGYVASKGGVLVGMQGLKALIHGRFDRAVYALRAMYPHISFHLFQPDGAVMRLMAGSPMRFFYRPEIEEIAFRETVRSIRQYRFDRLRTDFARQSVRFEDPESELDTIKRDLLDEASEVQVA
ncbi:MAG: patatin-like phospholipase family protein [Deltaproteobacteria bacterium]|nr:patatin-like phospholipase family protein [Deltaproteobacteria bacterium]